MKNIKQLIERFIVAAIKQEEALDKGNSFKANWQYNIMLKIFFILKDNNALYNLVPLLKHENDNVKFKAATYLLKEETEKAKEVLIELANSNSCIKTFAKQTLKAYDQGKLIVLDAYKS